MSDSCRHHDIRAFDWGRTCLACGEAVFDHPTTSRTELNANDQIYQYTRLNHTLGQEIRLLVVYAGELDDPPQGEIEIVNLRDRPEYEAVSYTWATEDGNLSLSGVLHTPDGIIPTTANCDGAIRRLRHTHSQRRLWIDAVCIDQSHVAERNHQVTLMEQIYSEAAQVLIYMDISVPKGYFRPLIDWVWSRGDRPSAEVKEAVAKLLTGRWFKRVWVIQEVALAKDVRLYLPDVETALNKQVVKRLHWLWKFQLPRNENMTIDWPTPLKWTPDDKDSFDLAYVLKATQSCSATDERDKVYAVLSLIDREYRSLIAVNYEASLEMVYVDVAKAMILRHATLDALHLHWRAHIPDWPTWVPRYGQSQQDDIHRGGILQFYGHKSGAWRSTLTLPSPKEHGSKQRDYSTDQDIPTVGFSLNYMRPCLSIRAHFIDVFQDWVVGPFDFESLWSIGRSMDCWLDSDLDFPYATDMEETDEKTLREQFWFGFAAPDPGLPVHQVRKFLRESEKIGMPPRVFRTTHSIGFAVGDEVRFSVEEDGTMPTFEIFALDGSRCPFILLKHDEDRYEISSKCYVTGALELHDGTWKKRDCYGLWGEYQVTLPKNQRTRMIDIY